MEINLDGADGLGVIRMTGSRGKTGRPTMRPPGLFSRKVRSIKLNRHSLIIDADFSNRAYRKIFHVLFLRLICRFGPVI